MLEWLTPSERRGGAVLIVLLLIGTGWDLWHSRSRLHPEDASSSAARWVRSAAPSDTGAGPRPPVPSASRPIDLNRASALELDALPGIGPVLAERIVEQRRRGGPFRRIEDLLAVRGVGPRLLERLGPLVHLGVAPATPADGNGVQSAPRAPAGRADSTSVVPPSSR